MRRWHFLHQWLRRKTRSPGIGAFSRSKNSETRENPAPVVFAPFSPQQTNEDIPLTFGSSGGFGAFDNAESGGELHTATLTTTNGTITVDQAAAESSFMLTVTGNGSAAVTITGPLVSIDAFLQSSGFNYNPSAFYSGEATVGLLVNNPTSGESDSGSVLVKVGPVASDAFLFVDSSKGEVWAPSGSGFAFPPGFVTISSWPDADGSETATITFSLFAGEESTEGFALFAGGTELEQLEPGLWQVSATSQSAMQSLLDSLTLVPPTGFTGRASLFVTGNLRDTASYPTDGSAAVVESPFGLGFGSADLRFFLGGNVTLPPVTAPEGSTVDLGGRFVATDPDELQGDIHALSLTVPSGLFTFNESVALSAGVSAERTVGPDGSTTILLLGNIAAINAFLAAPGSLLYSAPGPGLLRRRAADGHAGEPPRRTVLRDALRNARVRERAPVRSSGGRIRAGRGAGEVRRGRCADVPAFCRSRVPVGRRRGDEPGHAGRGADEHHGAAHGPVRVALARGGRRAGRLVVQQGHQPRQRNVGAFAVGPDRADVHPAPGTSGVFAMTVKAIVTDTATNGTTDTATESTAFTITVNPVVAPVTLVTPVTPILPPNVDELVGLEQQSVSGTVGSAVSADADGDGDDTPDEVKAEPLVLPDAFVGSVTSSTVSDSNESRVGLAPGEGSLFAQPESPQLSYGGGEKHPLPPVLPLDQTSSVAGFTESGGDSFALIDKLYRDAAVAQAEPKTDEAVVLASAQTNPEVVAPPVPPAPEQTVAVLTDAEFGVGARRVSRTWPRASGACGWRVVRSRGRWRRGRGCRTRPTGASRARSAGSFTPPADRARRVDVFDLPLARVQPRLRSK